MKNFLPRPSIEIIEEGKNGNGHCHIIENKDRLVWKLVRCTLSATKNLIFHYISYNKSNF
jgi:hypothetical protein